MSDGGGVVDRITEVIEAHEPVWASSIDMLVRCGCGHGHDIGGYDQDGHNAHVAAVVQAALNEARTITTQQQLDALPFLSVIREVFRPSPSGANYGGLYERRSGGWHCVAGTFKDTPDNGAPKLPCRVLWNPQEDE